MKRLFTLLLIALVAGCGSTSPEAKRLKEINPESYERLMAMTDMEMEGMLAANMLAGEAARQQIRDAARRQGKTEAEISVLDESMDLMMAIIRQKLKKQGK
jgi:hypothetical protein